MKKKYSDSYIKEEILNKTKLSNSDFVLVYDLIIYLLRKKLLTTKKINLRKFGVFYIYQYSRTKKIKLKKSYTLKAVLNKTKELKFEDFCYVHKKLVHDVKKDIDIYPIFLAMSKILNIKKNQAGYIFSLFIYGICRELLEHKRIGLKYFGEIYLEEREFKSNKAVICGREVTIINPTIIYIKMFKPFNDELNGKSTHFKVSKRLQKIFELQKIDLKVPKLEAKIKVENRFHKS